MPTEPAGRSGPQRDAPSESVVASLVGGLFSYAKIAWWGAVAPRVEREPLVVLQAVIVGDEGVLLSVRTDLRGWELPGGTLEAGEAFGEALRREVREETGLEVEVERHVGDYERTGFRPHLAKVYRCRPTGGVLERQQNEIRRLRWFPLDAPPDTLFPWYAKPLADAVVDTVAEGAAPAHVREHQGPAAILAGLSIDLRMRLSRDEAG